MKIAIYQPRISYYVGGGETVPLEMARLFSKHGHDVTIVTSKHPEGNSEYFQKYVKDNPKISYEFLELPNTLRWIYEKKPGSNQLRWDLEAVHVGRLAQDYFQNKSFDILNVHYRVDILAANPKYPTISFLHGVPTEKEYFDKVWFSFENTKYVSVSDYIGKKWTEIVGDIKSLTFTNGIDTSFYRPQPHINKDIDILYFGRLVPVKGVNYLIDAIKRLTNNGLTPKVVIAGNGTEKENLIAQVFKHGLQDHIEFLGYVPQGEILNLYNRSKIFAAPSFDREGVLTTMLEASACAVPTVTTNSCSMPEFIDDNINGLLANPKDSESLAEKLTLLLNDSSFRDQLGQKALEKAIAWDWDIKASKLENYFEDVIKQS